MAEFVERTQYIGQVEILAIVAAYTTFGYLLQGRRVLHFVDNTAALAAATAVGLVAATAVGLAATAVALAGAAGWSDMVACDG